MGIDVHRDSDARVSQELLGDLRLYAVLKASGREGMSYGVGMKIPEFHGLSVFFYYEPVELLNIVQNTGDEDCCRLFLNGFICESCRTDLMVLKNSIRKQADGNDEVSEHE